MKQFCQCGCPKAETSDLYLRKPDGSHVEIKDPAVHSHPGCRVIHQGRSCPNEPGLFEDKP